MSEQVAEQTAETADVQEQPKPTETVDFWKQKAREQEARAKANAAAALKLKEFEDRDKSDLEKLSERADSAEKRAADLEAQILRLEVAAAKGLTAAQAKRLVGATREELEADADELLTTFRPADVETPAIPSMDLGTRSPAPAALNGDPLLRDLKRHLGIS